MNGSTRASTCAVHNGRVEMPVTIEHAGTYMVEALVRGTVCDGEAAEWNS